MTPHHLKVCAACVIGGAVCVSPISAAGKDDTGGTFGLYLENDLFAGTDQHYTSGFKVSWSSRDLEQLGDSKYASPFLPIFNLLPYIDEISYQKTGWFTGPRSSRAKTRARLSARFR
ncbi:MAG: hypothetical protein B9S38_12235 [Verrucomicrobiia bacterium Tous-C4TDCM]|nr:MAG: hypothetical protein B9S38_12235 [Verrucomicrobiae bacterium Tous-C4TDCM]